MSPERLRALLAALPEVSEDEPFAPGVPVYKVAGKVFAIHQPDPPAQLTLKCDPSRALHLRQEFAAIVPGYHVDKRHWNTVLLDGSVPDELLAELIRHSYEQAAKGLRAADRDRVLQRLAADA